MLYVFKCLRITKNQTLNLGHPTGVAPLNQAYMTLDRLAGIRLCDLENGLVFTFYIHP